MIFPFIVSRGNIIYGKWLPKYKELVAVEIPVVFCTFFYWPLLSIAFHKLFLKRHLWRGRIINFIYCESFYFDINNGFFVILQFHRISRFKTTIFKEVSYTPKEVISWKLLCIIIQFSLGWTRYSLPLWWINEKFRCPLRR